MTIDAERLEEILKDSLFTDDEAETLGSDPDLTVEHYMELPEDERPFISVEGVIYNYAFNPGPLSMHRDEIKAMLDQLPLPFRQSSGGGWSFLNMCQTEDGELWGQHRNVEQLAVLAIALGLGSWALPKSMWSAFPSGMPYFIYKDQPAEVTS